MLLRRVLVLGGITLLIGAGCTGTTEDQVSDQDTQAETSSLSEVTEETDTMTLAHPGVLPDEKIKGKQVRIKTNKGTIVFKLYADTAPLTVSNFVYLAEQGYYDGLTWHRVVPDFVIQGGDPMGTGSGGPGYRFADEVGEGHVPAEVQEAFENHENGALYQTGLVAMANAGPDTNGSQFFIMLDDIPAEGMPNLYSIFGQVTEGEDVVDSIAQQDVMEKVTIEDAE